MREPEPFFVYSDVSYSKLRSEMYYAAVLVCDNHIVEQWTGCIPGATKTSIAEIVASTLAVARVPSRSIVFVYTDISIVVEKMQRPHISTMKNKEFRAAVNGLLRQLQRMKSFEIRLVTRSNKLYKWCHGAARREGIPRKYDTWQYWRAKKQARPQYLRYPLGPLITEAITGKLKGRNVED